LLPRILQFYTGLFILNRITAIYDIMAITKAHKFSDTQVRTAELAKALGHPARIAILEMLLEQVECICGDIADQLPLAQSTVSQHLKSLKEAGVIKGKVEGISVCYCIDEESVEDFSTLLGPFIETIHRPDRCCE